MDKKVFYLLFVVITLLPVTLLANGDKDWNWDFFHGRDIFSCRPDQHVTETPINPPNVTTVDNYGEPNPATWTGVGPYKLFDNLYYVGTTSRVGIFIVKTSAGLIVIDAGYGRNGDCETMEGLMTQAGLHPADVKMILLTHEHVDHYGCATPWQTGASPFAKVAMSRMGWNNLRTRPVELAFSGSRPEKIDMYLFDGQRIHLGDTTIQVVATPGHSMGTSSFIIPVREGRKKHVVGVMGGSAVPKSWGEAFMYYASVEYFKQACTEAKCDVGLNTHPKNWPAGVLDAFLARQPGDMTNPLVIGTEKFDTVFLQQFRTLAMDRMNSLTKLGPGDL